MKVSAKLKYTRVAPRKVRLIADLIRGRKADDADAVLTFTKNKSAGIFQKLLRQAITSAKNNLQIDQSNLYISKIIVDAGPILKRSRPRARGSAYEIQKKTSHIIITLDEIKETGKVVANKVQQSKKISMKESVSSERKAKTAQSKKATVIKSEKEDFKPQTGKGTKRIFRRKTF
jgi:large subunit ribosomal protein L22